jgi:hypothetical protein
VWNEPVETVAKRLGLSDVGLGKLCRRHNIPTPPRGYWARKTVGTHDPIPPLPVDHSSEAAIAISKWTEPATMGSVPGAVQQALDAEQLPTAQIVVNLKRRLANRAVLAARDALRQATPNERGIVRTSKYEPLPDVRVSPSSIPRALAIVEAWLDACATRGYTLKATAESRPQIQVLGTWFSLRVFERSIRVPNPTAAQLAKAKRLRPWDAHPQVFEPTGRLHLGLVEHTWDVHEWRETPNRPIEAQLNATILEMIRHAQYRLDQEAEHARREAHRAVAERMRARKQKRIKQFQSAATAYQQFLQLETFVAAVSHALEAGPADPRMARWTRWARLIIARDNPVKAALKRTGDDNSETLDSDSH